MTLCPLFCSNEIKARKHCRLLSSLKVLKRLRNIYGHFRQRSEVFGKLSEIFGSRRGVSENSGHDKVKITRI